LQRRPPDNVLVISDVAQIESQVVRWRSQRP